MAHNTYHRSGQPIALALTNRAARPTTACAKNMATDAAIPPARAEARRAIPITFMALYTMRPLPFSNGSEEG